MIDTYDWLMSNLEKAIRIPNSKSKSIKRKSKISNIYKDIWIGKIS